MLQIGDNITYILCKQEEKKTLVKQSMNREKGKEDAYFLMETNML